MNPSVIIIGAGIAGLAAAKQLKQKNIDCFILEGQQRIGGRINTIEEEDCLLDHGASWVHGVFGNPLSGILLSENIDSVMADENKNFLLGKSGKPFDDDGKTKQLVNSFEKDFVSKIKKDQSLTDAFKAHCLNKEFDEELLNWFKHEYMAGAGASLDDIDGRAYFTDEDQRGGDALILGGYEQVLKSLTEGIDIRLGEKVKHISCGHMVEVTIDSEKKYQCDAVLVTVPLGVLKNKVIEFFPPLPNRKTEAIENVQMGVLNKIFCFFESCFWDDSMEGFGVAGPEYSNFPYVLNLKPYTGKNLLCFFSYGEDARKMEDMTDDFISESIYRYLSPSFEDVPQISKLIRTCWANDPWAYGSYSYVKTGNSEEDYDILAEPYLNKIFFAGEATIADYRGTTNGAMESGVREAIKIIKLFT